MSRYNEVKHFDDDESEGIEDAAPSLEFAAMCGIALLTIAIVAAAALIRWVVQ